MSEAAPLQWQPTLDGWWLHDGKREFWMRREDAQAFAQAVLAARTQHMKGA